MKRGRVIVERKRKNARQRVQERVDDEEQSLSSSDSDVEQQQQQQASARSQGSARSATINLDDGSVDEDGDGDDDDEDEDGTLDFTQPDYAVQLSESQAIADSQQEDGEPSKTKSSAMPARVGQMSTKTIEDLSALLVRYMLYKASLKLPIRFADISKEVFPKYKNVSRYFFQKAKQQLESVFGYRVVAVDESSAKELYLVLNAQTSQEHLLLMNKNGKSPSRGFLMMVLGLLWCAQGRRISEDDLWKQLALLDSAIKPTRDHPQLGDVANLLKTFETQLYLQTSSELDVDLKKIKFYAYGPRTHHEVGKVQILNFVCKALCLSILMLKTDKLIGLCWCSIPQLITGRPPTDAQVDELALENQSSSGSESSDDDEETAVASNGSSDSEGSNAASGATATGRKRKRRSDEPSPPPSWVRAFAHVDGNWPSHVSITIGDDAELRTLCNRVISGAQQSMREDGGADADAEAAPLVPMESYHLSLSRPFVLQYDQISVFVDELRAALKWRHRFVISLSDVTMLVNDERTRSFLALRVAGGEKEFLATVKCVDRCMKQFALPLYYEDPIPHISIASSLGSSLPERLPQAQVHKLFLNETPWSTAITTVHVAIGNKQFQIPLQ